MGPPVTLDEIKDDWIAIEREAIQRYGQPVKACPSTCGILVRGRVNPKQWHFLTLPRAQTEFVDIATRDAVLARLLAP